LQDQKIDTTFTCKAKTSPVTHLPPVSPAEGDPRRWYGSPINVYKIKFSRRSEKVVIRTQVKRFGIFTLNIFRQHRDASCDIGQGLSQGLTQSTYQHQVQLLSQKFREVRPNSHGQHPDTLEDGFFGRRVLPSCERPSVPHGWTAKHTHPRLMGALWM
jgi:hypothetical protein